jgi:cell division protein FtsN
MPNDMKPKAPSRTGGRGMNPLFAGIIIGLLLGIFLALGVAVWLNRANQSSFVEKTKPVEPLPPIKQPTTSTAAPAGEAPKGTQAAGTDPAQPRFEFYQILPGEKEAKGSATAVSKDAAKDAPTAKAENLPSAAAESATRNIPTPVKSADETLFLQAGAFQNIADAENMKAKIAFAGFEASVKAVNLPEKGTLYRVRLGPYKSQDEANRVKGVLSQNGVSASVVRPD